LLRDHTNSQNAKLLQSDFEAIKLKLKGMLNMKEFRGTATSALGGTIKLKSPIGIGPLPRSINDVKMVLQDDK